MELLIKSPTYGDFIMLIDVEDYNNILNGKRLGVLKNKRKFYAVYYIGSDRKFVHKAVMNFTKKLVDHVDGNELNNQKVNLREATNSQNLCNRGLQSNNTTGYKGVYILKNVNKGNKRFGVKITHNNKVFSGGCFRTAKKAAMKYNELAIKYHGDFAYLNNIPNEDTSDDFIEHKPFSSKYKGVTAHKGKFIARIKCKGKQNYLGFYDSEELAYKAFLKATANKEADNFKDICKKILSESKIKK